MSNLHILIATIICGAIYLVRSIVVPPTHFPQNIPTIPFYVSFLGYFYGSDQREIYKKYLREHLEKYGAVKIYFASRWNILVTRPSLLTVIFKNENIYAKSGNQEKIPYSVLSAYTGDNIISSHGEHWKLYRSIVSSSIQFPDKEAVIKNAKIFTSILQQQVKMSKTVFVGDLLQRFTLENVGQSILGINLNAMEPNSEIHKQVKYIKQQIFKPLFLNFPYLDKLPIPSRMIARREVCRFRNYFCSKLFSGYVNENLAAKRLVDAYELGKLNAKQFQDNAIILMVAGHENPLLLMLSLMYCVAKYAQIQEKIREENDDEHPYLDSVIYETLRMYPPLGQIINRRTSVTTKLGDNIIIPKGTYVGYNNLGTGIDKTIWGSDADEFIPDRWGHTKEDICKRYKTAKRLGNLPAFHGGNRACIGEKFALFETKILMLEILKKYRIALDPNWKVKFSAAGPIVPVYLSITFEEL